LSQRIVAPYWQLPSAGAASNRPTVISPDAPAVIAVDLDQSEISE
jgi:hypothetical protein